MPKYDIPKAIAKDRKKKKKETTAKVTCSGSCGRNWRGTSLVVTLSLSSDVLIFVRCRSRNYFFLGRPLSAISQQTRTYSAISEQFEHLGKPHASAYYAQRN